MSKYFTIIKTYWQKGLTYRFTILAHKFGEMGETAILVLMWLAIYGNEKMIKGFTLPEMITYVLIGNLFNSVVRNFLPNAMKGDMKDGGLSVYLVRPMSYFSFIFYREIGRESIVIFLSVISQGLVILFFLNYFIFNYNILYLLAVIAMLVLAFITELLLSYIIGLVAFWTDEVDGLYATHERLRKIFSGGYFPISILPAFFVNISYALPFAYSFYVPAQLYLKKIDLAAGVRGIFVQITWIIMLYAASNWVWKRGLKRYEGTGI
jgi:ABC-2 type transport system permease protein